MHFEHLTTTPLDLEQQLQWLWHSERSSSFIVGDERVAFALPHSDFGVPSRLVPARPSGRPNAIHHPCNLPIPGSLYEELVSDGWCGFYFLEATAYDHAVDDDGQPLGDLLRTLVFGPDYGHYVLHRASDLVLGLRSGSIQLLRFSQGRFTKLADARTRGRAALAFAAHPREMLIAYGDNYGNFYAHRFSPDGFGKTKKIATKDRKASTLRFIVDGDSLLIGGMGYLSVYSHFDSKFYLLHEISLPVRDFTWDENRRIVFVNQGLHGVAVYRYDETGFSQVGAVKAEAAVNQMAVALRSQYLAVSSQHSTDVSVYAISHT